MQMDKDTIYRLSEITVNADELRRIRDELDEQLASGLALYRRVDNLINQGTVASRKTNASEKEKGDQIADPRADAGEDLQRHRDAQDGSYRA